MLRVVQREGVGGWCRKGRKEKREERRSEEEGKKKRSVANRSPQTSQTPTVLQVI